MTQRPERRVDYATITTNTGKKHVEVDDGGVYRDRRPRPGRAAMTDIPDQWAAAEPRVHRYFAFELAGLIEQWAEARRADGYERRALGEAEDCAAWVADRLEFHGWKIDPSRQRRMQLDAPATPNLEN